MTITQEIIDAKKEEFFARGGVIERVMPDSGIASQTPESLSLSKNSEKDRKELAKLYGDTLDIERSRKHHHDHYRTSLVLLNRGETLTNKGML